MDDNKIWEFYNGLILSQDIDRIRKLLVRYDLFKMSLNIPGDIVECGVFKGVGLMYWLKLLRIFAHGSQKKVIGFDTFSSFSKDLLPYEKHSAELYMKDSSFKGIDPKEILSLAETADFGDLVELIAGEIQEKCKEYVANNPGFRISLLHCDLDTYKGTKAALENFYPVVSRGGVIIFDDYAFRGWGESDAVDEYFKNKEVKILSLPYSTKPTAYIIKP